MFLTKTSKQNIILFTIFFSWVNFAYANIEISEIMYSPEGGSNYEWVEIYNNGSTPVDLNKYRFFHGETNSSPISLKSGSTSILQPSKYAVIAKSLSDYSWLNFSDMIFSSSALSLPDSGDNTYIAISDANKTILDYTTYDVANGGSKASKSSLSKINGEWGSGMPTPGRTNQSNTNPNTDAVTSTNSTSDTVYSNSNSISTSSNVSNKDSGVLKVTTKIISPKIVVAGIPFLFSSQTTTNKGDTYAFGKMVWNFGNGMINQVNGAGPFEYTYEYPGEYSMTLSYYSNNFNKQADATNRIIIKVVASEIYISSVGDETNPFIELENKSNYDITLSNWIVTAGTHYFIIPEGTTLLPGKKIKLSPKITGFTGEDIGSVVITNIKKEVIASYPTIAKKSVQKNSQFNNQKNDNPAILNEINNNSQSKDSQIINLNDLSANASQSGVDVSNGTYAFIGLTIIVGMGIAAFLMIKRKDNKADYVGSEIRPEDMSIVE
ncbi:MAG: lamin tail domain-containing protein [Candidatus Nomurabacteria bacterium]|nr:lamin tail domain-containing protein [Candidatus Nomurabacteria bacterium]